MTATLHGAVAVTETRLAAHLGGQVWMADIVAVKCLKDRIRPLLRCRRAHKGIFKRCNFRGGELACRRCHALRYRSNLASGKSERVNLQRDKAPAALGCRPGDIVPLRLYRAWRRRYGGLVDHLAVRQGCITTKVCKCLSFSNRSGTCI